MATLDDMLEAFEEDDQDWGECPECGAPMDGHVCTECDYDEYDF